MNIKQLSKNKKIVGISLLVAFGAIAVFFVLFSDNLKTQIRKSYPVSKSIQTANWAAFAFTTHDQTKIGWVSDIHADRFKRRDINSGLMFPRKYSDYLPKVFADLQKQGINTVIATGDNTNSGDNNYAQDLARIASEKNMHVIWVKGNHDNDKVMATLGVSGSKYYYTDIAGTRIIALDDVEGDGNYQGSIDQAQLAWLKNALNTPQQVIVTMHIPIFNEINLEGQHDLKGGDFDGAGDLLDRYRELENILHSSGNVKMVLSGHWHLPWHKEFDGLNYYGQAALTRTGYDGAYAIVDLKNDSVQYKFAK